MPCASGLDQRVMAVTQQYPVSEDVSQTLCYMRLKIVAKLAKSGTQSIYLNLYDNWID